MSSRPFLVGASAFALAALIAGCSGSADTTAATGSKIAVTASDTECILDIATVAGGTVEFEVANKGSDVTEVYVYGASSDGRFSTVVSEVENIGPGVSRDMTADLPAGTYEVACKPGQKGDGIRSTLTVETNSSAGSAPVGTLVPARVRELSIAEAGVAESGELEGTTGERIEFLVTNKASSARVFEVKRPDGSVAGEIEIEPGAERELYVDLEVPGDWLLIVEGESEETESTFTVS